MKNVHFLNASNQLEIFPKRKLRLSVRVATKCFAKNAVGLGWEQLTSIAGTISVLTFTRLWRILKKQENFNFQV